MTRKKLSCILGYELISQGGNLKQNRRCIALNRSLIRRKALAWLLVVAMFFSFVGGINISPAFAQENETEGDFRLRVGNYRGLIQTPSVPVTVENVTDLMALEFTVVSETTHDIDVAVAGVERGADLPGGATITWSGVGHGNVKIGIFLHQQGFSGDGELVRINYRHTGIELPVNQVIHLTIDPGSVTARVLGEDIADDQVFIDDTVELNVPRDAIRNGFINVAIMFGDMDKNDRVTINDAVLALRATVGDLELTPQLLDAGDVKRAPGTRAESVTVYDALLIARRAVGLIEFFPVAPPDVDDDVGDRIDTFTIQPSRISIGDFELQDPRTIIGGDVTFTVEFPTRITGDVKVEVSGPTAVSTNSEFINNANRVDITVDVRDQTSGLGERVVSAYQYNTVTKEKGIPLDRFVKVIDPLPTPSLDITATRDTELDFRWGETHAAKHITVRQSIDSSAWVNARTSVETLSTHTAATVTNLDNQRGYYFKLLVNNGVHAGISDIIRFNRMTGDVIAEQVGDHLHVIVLYTGEFRNLNTDRFDDFKLIRADGSEVPASSISRHQRRGIRVIFNNVSEEDFTLRYTGRIDNLDRDGFSFVLGLDEVTLDEPHMVNEVSVATAQELRDALDNTSVDRIALGNNITANINVTRSDLEIDGDGRTLTGNVTVNNGANFVSINNLTITGNLTVSGDDFSGQSLTVGGATQINGERASFNTTFEDDVTVAAAAIDTLFTNVTFEEDLMVAAGATGLELDNCVLQGDVSLNEDATFKDLRLEQNSRIQIANNKTLTLNGTVNVYNRMLTFDTTAGGTATVDGQRETTIIGTTGRVVFADTGTGSGVDVKDLNFATRVDVNEDVSFTDVEFSDDLTVTVASGKTLEFLESIIIAGLRTVTFAGAGTVDFNLSDLDLANVVFSIENVDLGVTGGDASLKDVNFNNNVTVTLRDNLTLTIDGNVGVTSGRTLTIDTLGTSTVIGSNTTIGGNARIIDLLTFENVTFGGGLIIDGDPTLNNVVVNGTLRFSGAQCTVTVRNTFRTAAVNTAGADHVFDLITGSNWTLTGNVNTTDNLWLTGTGTIAGALQFGSQGLVTVDGTLNIMSANFAGSVRNLTGDTTYGGSISGNVENIDGDATYRGNIGGNVTHTDGTATYERNIGGNVTVALNNPVFKGAIAGNVTINGDITFDGATLNQGSTLNVNDNTVTLAGNLSLGTGTVLRLNDADSLVTGAYTISGAGSVATGVAASSPTKGLAGVTLSVPLNIGEDLILNDVTLNQATVVGANKITLEGDLTLGANLTLDNAASELDGNGNTVKGTGKVIVDVGDGGIDDVVFDVDVDVNDDVTMNDGGWSAGKTVTVADGVTLTFTGSVANNGNLVLAGPTAKIDVDATVLVTDPEISIGNVAGTGSGGNATFDIVQSKFTQASIADNGDAKDTETVSVSFYDFEITNTDATDANDNGFNFAIDTNNRVTVTLNLGNPSEAADADGTWEVTISWENNDGSVEVEVDIDIVVSGGQITSISE